MMIKGKACLNTFCHASNRRVVKLTGRLPRQVSFRQRLQSWPAGQISRGNADMMWVIQLAGRVPRLDSIRQRLQSWETLNKIQTLMHSEEPTKPGAEDGLVQRLPRQAGLVLFVCLILLLILSLLGVSAVQMTLMQEKMSRTLVDTGLAFQAAESAIQDGETYLHSLVPTLQSPDGLTFTASAAAGLYHQSAAHSSPIWETNLWSGTSGYRTGSTLPSTALPPKYIIEQLDATRPLPTAESDLQNEQAGNDEGNPGLLGDLPDESNGTMPATAPVFRITALGYGGTSNARIMLQSTWGSLPQGSESTPRFGRLSWRQLP